MSPSKPLEWTQHKDNNPKWKGSPSGIAIVLFLFLGFCLVTEKVCWGKFLEFFVFKISISYWFLLIKMFLNCIEVTCCGIYIWIQGLKKKRKEQGDFVFGCHENWRKSKKIGFLIISTFKILKLKLKLKLFLF